MNVTDRTKKQGPCMGALFFYASDRDTVLILSDRRGGYGVLSTSVQAGEAGVDKVEVHLNSAQRSAASGDAVQGNGQR